MNIYTSSKALPYVYMGTHNMTGKFYIGYREKNTTPSSSDLYKYRTSSKIVKPNFKDYNWTIIAEFFSGNDAYDFEQQLISECWGDPRLINRNVQHGRKRFKSHKGRVGPMLGKAVAKDPNTGEILGGIPTSDPRWSTGEIIFFHTGRKQSRETIEQRLNNTDRNKLKSRLGVCGKLHPNFGKTVSDDTRLKLSATLKGKKKPDGFGQGIKNSQFGKRRPGLNAGKKNSMFGKTGDLHPNFGKTMPITCGRFRGRLDLYLNVISMLEGGMSVRDVHKDTGISVDVIYAIRSKNHSIWKYIENENKFKK